MFGPYASTGLLKRFAFGLWLAAQEVNGKRNGNVSRVCLFLLMCKMVIVSKLPLLLIDDEADNASVDTAVQAFDEEGKPDLILMDVVMPGTNGFQLTRKITRDPRFSDVPVIMCTSKTAETDRVWGMRQGARDYITKPVHRTELLDKIKALG